MPILKNFFNCCLKVTRKAAVASSFCCSNRFNYLTFSSCGSCAACQWQTLISVTFSSIIKSFASPFSASFLLSSYHLHRPWHYIILLFHSSLVCVLADALSLHLFCVCVFGLFNTYVYFASLPLPSCSYTYLLFCPHSCLLLFPVNLPTSCYLGALQLTVKPTVCQSRKLVHKGTPSIHFLYSSTVIQR